MTCEHSECHCQSEIGMEKNGGTYCSERCASDAVNHRENCGCGHAGCSTAEEPMAIA